MFPCLLKLEQALKPLISNTFKKIFAFCQGLARVLRPICMIGLDWLVRISALGRGDRVG